MGPQKSMSGGENCRMGLNTSSAFAMSPV